jgi:predicted nuclease of restriction endonuclease-like RecB superfamily
MLTREQAIAEYDFSRGLIIPDRLTLKSHARYVAYAERMLEIYRRGAGTTRRELHQRVAEVFSDEDDCPQKRIDAFCKLLDDAGEFERDRRGQAAELRREVFRRAALLHPLVRSADRLFENGEARVKHEIAEALGRPWADIEAGLFADVIEFHRLQSFAGFPDGRALLSRYNVSQVQAALFDAQSLSIWASTDFKTILRYAKLARLMHTILQLATGEYLFRFDGAASIVRETRRYGAALARFLPALIACRGWRLHAVIQSRSGSWKLGLDLSSEDGLTSHLPPPEEFDSELEEDFAFRWGSEPRGGWTLVREGEVLHFGQKVFVPDFVFRHEDGRTVLMEIVGFWTPEYLQAKRATLRAFGRHSILLAVAESLREQLPESDTNVVPFKSALKVNDVLARLASCTSGLQPDCDVGASI